MRSLSKTLLLIFSFFLIADLAQSHDERDDDHKSTIRVTGESTVMAKPDQARIQISVVTQARTSQSAATENARKADRIINSLRKKFAADVEIKTISYSVTPNYTYPKEGGEPKIVGYIASNTVEAKTPKLEQVGDMIDVAVESGANNIQALEFGLKDELPSRADALRRAVTQARAKADAIASALGVKIVRIVQVEEAGAVVVPMQKTMAMRAEAADQAQTPVEAGTIEVHGNVTLTVEVQ